MMIDMLLQGFATSEVLHFECRKTLDEKDFKPLVTYEQKHQN